MTTCPECSKEIAPDPEKYFDLESVFNSEIVPLIDQLRVICKTHRMPMLSAVLYKVSEEGSAVSFTATGGDDRYVPDEMRLARGVLIQEFVPEVY